MLFRAFFSFVVMSATLHAAAFTFPIENRYTLWYDSPATAHPECSNTWMEYALPIGNGELGAMISADVNDDRIQFNEKSLWTGSPTERGSYQNFGFLCITALSPSTAPKAENYRRTLDLSTGIASAAWSVNGQDVHRREYLCSNPDSAIIVHLQSTEKAGMSYRISLLNALGAATHYDNEGGATKGRLQTISYAAQFAVSAKGGKIETKQDGIYVNNAKEILIVLAAKTDFANDSPTYTRHTAELDKTVATRMTNAMRKGWKKLRQHHVADHSALFSRVNLSLHSASNDMPTDKLVDFVNNEQSNATAEGYRRLLEELYFIYGRYLAIACSRGMALPSNLQGLWCNSSHPAWESDIHSNINVEMNYWPVESTNLSETHLPFLQYLYNMAIVQPEWQKYANNSGQSVGWTCYTQNNIFGHSDFMENYVIANAWYCVHLWQHYQYTLSRDYLCHLALPVMMNCSSYWMERLIPDRRVNDGTLVCPNEWSAEHGPNEDATAHSQQLVWYLLHSTLAAIETLGADANVAQSYTDKLRATLKKVDTGLHTETFEDKTILREWKYTDFLTGNGGEKAHRHMSHLMCLYPLGTVGPNSHYFKPAVESLLLRGDQSTGWSMGWKINLWARALDGNHAHLILRNALRHSRSYGVDARYGGIYYNLFDSHAPFQIDGNFGATAGVAEMLMQSYNDTIQILPALPDAWAVGEVKGLKAMGGFEVDIDWEDMRPVTVRIVSHHGGPCRLTHSLIGKKTLLTTAKGRPINAVKDDAQCTFDTKPGDVVLIKF